MADAPDEQTVPDVTTGDTTPKSRRALAAARSDLQGRTSRRRQENVVATAAAADDGGDLREQNGRELKSNVGSHVASKQSSEEVR